MMMRASESNRFDTFYRENFSLDVYKRPFGLQYIYKIVLCILLTFSEIGLGFNVAPKASYVASLPDKTNLDGRSAYFGYSVALLETNNNGKWLLAGAPRANSSASSGFLETGSFYKCPLENQLPNCEEVILDSTGYAHTLDGDRPLRSKSWIGAAMDIDKEGNVIVCAPRWKNTYSNTNREYRISGTCYVVGQDLENLSAINLKPLIKYENQIYNFYGKGVYYYAHGQCGFGVHVTNQSEVLVGSPGVMNWQGTVLKYEEQESIPSGGISKRSPSVYYVGKRVPNPIHTAAIQDSNFFGYSVTSGKFDNKNGLYYVAGAPRGADSLGKVLVYLLRRTDSQPLFIKEARQGTQMGEYFGASVAAPDINGDGMSDLVVGAPLHSINDLYEVGCIYLFMNNERKVGELAVEGVKLFGDIKKRARFGSAIGTNDLDKDGFEDILVGAPYENEGEGAVYIFMGTRAGVNEKYYQKLVPEEADSSPLRGFGVSFSRPLDVDNNAYPDFAVGSFLSDKAVLMLTRPVVILSGLISATSTRLSLSDKEFTIQPCVSYTGFSLPSEIEILARLSLSQESQTGEFVATFVDTGSTEREIDFLAKSFRQTCEQFSVDLNLGRSNAQNPVTVRMSLDLKNKEYKGPDNPIMSPHSASPPNLVLSFITGCGDDNICRSDLKVIPRFKGFVANDKLLIGSVAKITLEIEVINTEEPAFLPNITVVIPAPIIVLPSMKDCATSQDLAMTTVVCQLLNPLTDEAEIINLDLDLTHIDDSSSDIVVNTAVQSTADEDIEPSDNNRSVTLGVEKKASIKFNGWSRPEQFTFQRDSEQQVKINQKTEVEHFFSIEKSGTTPLREVEIFILLPRTTSDRDGNQISIVKSIATELTFHGQSRSCAVSDGRKKKKAKLVQGSKVIASKVVEKSGLPYTELNCSLANVHCASVSCIVGPWKKSYDIALLKISFDVNVSSLGDIISVTEGFSFVSSIDAEVSSYKGVPELQGYRSDSGTVETTFRPSALLAKSLAWWIYLLAILGGLLLLLLIAYILYKLGFFKRKRKEELEAQQATLMSQEEK